MRLTLVAVLILAPLPVSADPHAALKPQFRVPRVVAGVTCTTTITTATDLNTAITNIADGGTLCLQAGTYVAVNTTAAKSSQTIIRAASGVSASSVHIPSVTVGAAGSRLTFLSVSIGPNASEIGPVAAGNTAATHIYFDTITFSGVVNINEPQNVNQDTIVQNSTFASIDLAVDGMEGRLNVQGLATTHTVDTGVYFQHNTFGPGGCSDGIQTTTGARWVHIKYNEFKGIKQHGYMGSTDCDTVDGVSGTPGIQAPHVDPIQPYDAADIEIVGNYFHDNSTGVMNPDCSDRLTFTDNVFWSDGEYPDQVVMTGGSSATTFQHNTFLASGIRFGNPNSCGLNSGISLTDNIVRGGLNLTEGQGTGSFTINFNNGIGGTNAISGTPTYMGGTTPSTFAGYELANGSVGENASSTGNDIGTTYHGALGP